MVKISDVVKRLKSKDTFNQSLTKDLARKKHVNARAVNA